MTDDSVSILRAIEKSSERTETVIGELSNEIRVMAHAITEGFSRPSFKHNSNGGLYGVIATFAVVIIALGSIFFSMIAGQSERTDLLAEF